jgi:hypothetical protein
MFVDLPFPLALVLVLLAVGFFVWIVQQANFIAEPWKKIATAVALFCTLVWLVLALYHAYFAGSVPAVPHGRGY